MAKVNVSLSNAGKVLMPGMNAYLKDICDKQVEEILKPVREECEKRINDIKTQVVTEFYNRFRTTVEHIHELDDAKTRLVLVVNYADGTKEVQNCD